MSSLFDAVGDICRTQYNLGAKPTPDLKQYQYCDDIGLGWSIHCGYSVDWDDGRAGVWIHKMELDTGMHLIALALNDVPPEDIQAIEKLIADEEEASARAACESLAFDKDDYGDWLHEQRKDRQP